MKSAKELRVITDEAICLKSTVDSILICIDKLATKAAKHGESFILFDSYKPCPVVEALLINKLEILGFAIAHMESKHLCISW